MPNPALREPISFEELEKNAQPDDSFEKAIDKMRREREESSVDEEVSRRNDTWGLLATQVVGQEHF